MFLWQPIITNDYLTIITIIGPTSNRSDASPKSDAHCNWRLGKSWWSGYKGSNHLGLEREKWPEREILERIAGSWKRGATMMNCGQPDIRLPPQASPPCSRFCSCAWFPSFLSCKFSSRSWIACARGDGDTSEMSSFLFSLWYSCNPWSGCD